MILDLLQRVCKSLDENNIPYMIYGSIAWYVQLTMQQGLKLTLSYEKKLNILNKPFKNVNELENWILNLSRCFSQPKFIHVF